MNVPPSARPFAICAVIIALAGACGASEAASDTAPGVASISVEPSPAAGPADADPEPELEAPEDIEDAFALFDECMADRGFDFGESLVVGGSGGGLEVESVEEAPQGVDPQGQGLEDFDAEKFDEANAECEKHLAGVDGGFDLTPEQEAAFADAQLEWTDCMRDQGVEVPEFDGGSGAIVIEAEAVEGDPQGPGGFGDADFDFEAFQEAASECDHVFEEAEGLEGLFEEEPS